VSKNLCLPEPYYYLHYCKIYISNEALPTVAFGGDEARTGLRNAEYERMGKCNPGQPATATTKVGGKIRQSNHQQQQATAVLELDQIGPTTREQGLLLFGAKRHSLVVPRTQGVCGRVGGVRKEERERIR
jgi:hypothetical protein